MPCLVNARSSALHCTQLSFVYTVIDSADIPTPFLCSATRSGKHVALFQLEVPCTLLAGTDNPAPPRRGHPRKPLHSRRMSSSCDEQPQQRSVSSGRSKQTGVGRG